MDIIMKTRYDKLGPKVAAALEGRGFEAYYCSTLSEAREKALSFIPIGSTIGYGGTLTLNQIDLKDTFRNGDYNLIDRDLAPTPEEKTALQRAAFSADWYIMGCNGISEDGQLFNIDGIGNRVAALIYGPDHVLIVAGMNKVVKSTEDAYSRARNIAAPANMQRFSGLGTPCSVTGACADCNSPGCICNQIVFTRRCNPPKRIKVILIGEDLGL